MKADKYYFEHEAGAGIAQMRGELKKIERNTLNPLCGLTFVSIAYYEMDGKIVGVVF